MKQNLLHEFTSKYRQVYYDETDTCGVIMHLIHVSLRNTLSTTAVTSLSRHNTDTHKVTRKILWNFKLLLV